MRYETSVDINAEPDVIWDVLADVERWPEWTASMSRVERLDGDPFGEGSTARVKQPRLPANRWRVTDYVRGESFSWESRSPGVTSLAEHRIAAREGGGSRVSLVLTQTGPLARLVGMLGGRLIRRYVRLEAEGLKYDAEARVG